MNYYIDNTVVYYLYYFYMLKKIYINVPRFILNGNTYDISSIFFFEGNLPRIIRHPLDAIELTEC